MDMTLDDLPMADLIPVPVAASVLGMTPSRLIGFIARNSLADPIGDWRSVYGWSCRTLARRAVHSSEVRHED